MKKSTLLLTLLAMPLLASAQYAFDALTYSQTELLAHRVMSLWVARLAPLVATSQL